MILLIYRQLSLEYKKYNKQSRITIIKHIQNNKHLLVHEQKEGSSKKNISEEKLVKQLFSTVVVSSVEEGQMFTS